MKVISIAEAAPQLRQLFVDAMKGETILLTNGVDSVELTPRTSEIPDPPDAIENMEQLEKALLEGLEGKAIPYSAERLTEACRQALRESNGA
jgi:hypothetical protein